MSSSTNLESALNTLDISFCPSALSVPLCEASTQLNDTTNNVLDIADQVTKSLTSVTNGLRDREIAFFGQAGNNLSGVWDEFVNFLNTELMQLDNRAKELAPRIISGIESELAIIRTPLLIFLVVIIIVLLLLLIVVIRLYFPRLFGAKN